VAATNDVDTESLPASEIPVSGTATESSEGVRALQDGIAKFRRAQELQPDTPTVEDRRKQWLASNEAARTHYGRLGELHQRAIESGLTDMSPGYVDFMNQRIAELARETREPPQRAEPDRSSIVPHQ